MIVKPNLFLLGAPKCATTSFYVHLGRHPQILCPSIKEPNYFSREELRPEFSRANPHQKSLEAYLDLFRTNNSSVRAAVDGSTTYLRNEKAIIEIAQLLPQARALAIVRDPVELVSSYYEYLRHMTWEDQNTLREAWALQGPRSRGEHIYHNANIPSSLLYTHVAKLGEQVKRAQDIFGDRFLVYTLEEFHGNFSAISSQVQAFCGVEPMELGDLPKLNPARTARFHMLNTFVKNPPPPFRQVRNALKKTLGFPSLGLRSAMEEINSVKRDRQIDSALVSEMRDYFRPDVEVLNLCMNRNLFEEWGWT